MCCAVLSYVQLFGTPQTVAHQAPLSMGILQARILEWVAISFSRGSSQPRDQSQVSCIAGGFFTFWATREAQEYLRGGSLSLLQGIFLTQQLNQGFLHCRQILYQLSYQGSLLAKLALVWHLDSQIWRMFSPFSNLWFTVPKMFI